MLERAASTIQHAHRAGLRAGVGAPFRGLGGFAASYRQARRAHVYAGERRPFVFWPDDVLLFDELTAASGEAGAELIPEATRRLLTDGAMRATLEAFFAADLNVARAAGALVVHPNSLRYRLRRMAEITGRDPRRLADMIELMAAARLIVATAPAVE